MVLFRETDGIAYNVKKSGADKEKQVKIYLGHNFIRQVCRPSRKKILKIQLKELGNRVHSTLFALRILDRGGSNHHAPVHFTSGDKFN